MDGFRCCAVNGRLGHLPDGERTLLLWFPAALQLADDFGEAVAEEFVIASTTAVEERVGTARHLHVFALAQA
jgi:hypothetical protein